LGIDGRADEGGRKPEGECFHGRYLGSVGTVHEERFRKAAVPELRAARRLIPAATAFDSGGFREGW
jgi:hypothetical protein